VKDKAIIAFRKAGEAFEKLELPFKAGQKYEAGGVLSKELKKTEEAVSLLQMAAICFQQHGASDKASEVFLKAAKAAEEGGQLDKALEICIQSIDLLETDQKWLYVAANYRATTGLLVKRGQYDKAIEFYKKQTNVHEKNSQEMDVWKCVLSIIILNLLRDDYVSAEKAFTELASESPGWVKGDYGIAANQLLHSIEKKDKELFERLQQQQIFTFLDIEVARVFKKLTLNSASAGQNQKEESFS